jgi:ketosteroid isomerase-like protein
MVTTGEDNSASIVPTIKQLVEQFVAAYNKGNSTVIGSLFAKDSVLMPPGEPPIKGNEEIKWRFHVFFDGFTFALRLDSLETYLVGDLCFDRGTYIAYALPVEGGVPRGGEGEYTFLFEEELPGSWKISAFGTSPSAGTLSDTDQLPTGDRLVATLADLRNSEVKGRRSEE